MHADSGVDVPVLRVDGGGTANRFLMQFQADILGIPIEVAEVQETTARGAAYLAGLGIGIWPDRSTIAAQWRPASRYEPRMAADRRGELIDSWRRAVDRARSWATA
jgi:glycerol kinase